MYDLTIKRVRASQLHPNRVTMCETLTEKKDERTGDQGTREHGKFLTLLKNKA